jgi:DNA-binding PadR family transcriptional regulator
MSKRAMQETTFLILTALAQGPQHGYGIIQDVGRISGDRVVLRAGSLYGALERLDADGLISVDREEVVEGRLRRYYRLTDEGSARLVEEARRLQESAATALQRLGALRPGLAGGAAGARPTVSRPRPLARRARSSSGATAGCCACTRVSSGPGARRRCSAC